MIFLDFRCVNLILNDAKGSKYERQIVINFFAYLLLSSSYFFVSASSLRNCSSNQQLTLLEVRSLELT